MCQTLLPTSLYVHTVNVPHEEAGHREVKAFTQDTVANEGLGPRQSGSRAPLLNNASEPDRPSLGFRSFHQALGCQAPARERQRQRQRKISNHHHNSTLECLHHSHKISLSSFGGRAFLLPPNQGNYSSTLYFSLFFFAFSRNFM